MLINIIIFKGLAFSINAELDGLELRITDLEKIARMELVLHVLHVPHLGTLLPSVQTILPMLLVPLELALVRIPVTELKDSYSMDIHYLSPISHCSAIRPCNYSHQHTRTLPCPPSSGRKLSRSTCFHQNK